MQSTSHLAARELIESIREVVCAVTRYPAQFVTNDTEFEDELGIDAVQLTEILAALRQRYAIDDQVAKELGELRTIAAIAAHLSRRIGSSRPPQAPQQVRAEPSRPPRRPPAPEPPLYGAAAPDSGEGLERQITRLLAEVTRYPEHLLGPELDFAVDLGIDSVKQAEILATLRERFSARAAIDSAALPVKELRTIRQIAAAIEPLLRRSAAPERTEPAAARSADLSPNPSPSQTPERSDCPGLGKTSERGAAKGLPFAGKTILVTSSAHGLGKELAAHLARLGAALVVHSHDSRDMVEQAARELQAHGGRAVHVVGAAADPAHVEQMLAQIERECGALDGLVFCESGSHFARQSDLTPALWERAFRNQVTALHLLAVRGARLLRRRGGRIVALSSSAAPRCLEFGGTQGPAAAAVESLVRQLAVELAEGGIRVNGVAAGPVADDPLSKLPESARLLSAWTARTPVQRLCTSSDIASVVEFLLSDKAQMVNGCIVTVDGGLALLG